MSKLIIAEKPSVAKSIASALGASSRADGFYEGSGLIVSWCVGHLVSPLDAGGYDERFKKWRYEDLPILPEPFRYAPIPGKEAALDNVKHLMAREDVTEIVNACDAGREGELIFRLVYEMSGCRKPVLRLWISSMEDSAIREGFSELRPGADYEALYQSALCRQRADWLVGINATRLFSVLYHRTLNVGRVQTPTLSLLAARDAKIALFQKEKYHHVRLTLAGAEAVSERFTDPAEAEQAAACKGAVATCISVTKEQKKEQPPKLYDLTTLQREANRLLGYTAKQTLDYAQSLYGHEQPQHEFREAPDDEGIEDIGDVFVEQRPCGSVQRAGLAPAADVPRRQRGQHRTAQQADQQHLPPLYAGDHREGRGPEVEEQRADERPHDDHRMQTHQAALEEALERHAVPAVVVGVADHEAREHEEEVDGQILEGNQNILRRSCSAQSW